jgi:hypothetical protein
MSHRKKEKTWEAIQEEERKRGVVGRQTGGEAWL